MPAGASIAILEIDGQKRLYRNEKEMWNPMIWPGPKPTGARIGRDLPQADRQAVYDAVVQQGVAVVRGQRLSDRWPDLLSQASLAIVNNAIVEYAKELYARSSLGVFISCSIHVLSSARNRAAIVQHIISETERALTDTDAAMHA